MQVLFRAKEKNSNNYVIGYEYYNHIEDEYYITHYVSGSNYKVDRTTRSINIEDMIDSQGSKIFASLQKDGKGGDIIHHKKPFCKDEKKYYEWAVKFDKRRVTPFIEREYWNPNRVPLMDIFTNPKAKVKVMGIQE